MRHMNAVYILFFTLLTISFRVSAQDHERAVAENSLQLKNETITIREIVLTGNRKTRRSIILRELPFQAGEKYQSGDIEKIFDRARRQLMNTALFYKAELVLFNREGDQADIGVNVIERCYLFPIPYFETVDRNLNQWLVEQKGDLSRVNLGARIQYNNATGRNDKLRLTFITGYTHQFSLNYDRIYIDKKLKWGLSVGFSTGKNREINYNTVNDRQVFMKDEKKYLRSFTQAVAEVSYRKAIKTRHSFGIQYSVEEVSDTVTAMNPFYFKSGANKIGYPVLFYTLTYLDLDFNPYPTKGT
ncbi:MAG TPA: POTRA domain-containing protein, partial [Chitinophagaceae bacterium]|nr:POTRA domain-containing protein [Chitinophagaceae bacterium]